MKRLVFSLIFIVSAFVGGISIGVSAGSLAQKLSGRVLLQVQQKGEAWYINPIDLKRYYLGGPADAFTILRQLGLGITDADLNAIPIAQNSKVNTPSTQEDQWVASEQEPQPSIKTYEVIKIIDGDTLTVSINGTSETLRLIGMDTPETVDPRKPVQCFGIAASDKAKEILSGQRVQLETDPIQGERDKYSRLLRYIFLEDGTNYQEYMIRQGYAHEYTYNLPYKYQAQFKQAQDEARLNKRGLWADGVCEEKSTPAAQESTPAPQSTSATPTAPAQLSGSAAYDCSGNKYNCNRDFKTHKEAQAVFDYCGGVGNDVHGLDRDKDGLACESLP